MHPIYEGTAIARYRLLRCQRESHHQNISSPIMRAGSWMTIRQRIGSFLIALGKKFYRTRRAVMGVSPQPSKS